MSLDVNIRKIKNHETLCLEPDPENPGHERFTAKLTALAFASMFVGLGTLTEANLAKWEERIQIMTIIGLAIMDTYDKETKEVKPWVPVGDELRAYIGLQTNVFPAESDAVFNKKVIQNLKREAQSLLHFARKEEVLSKEQEG